jgi:hypothetical protein
MAWPEGGAGANAPRDVAEGVAPSAQHQHGHVEAAHEGDAVGVALEREVEAAQSVARQGVGAALPWCE